MRRTFRALLLLALVTGAALFIRAGRPDPDPIPGTLFHPSDVALLSSTGRPQLVEFFHHA